MLAGTQDSITGHAGDRINFSGAIEALLERGNAAMSSLGGDLVIGGGAFAAGVTNIRLTAAKQLQIDLNGDGAFTAASDFQIALTGGAVTTVTYVAAGDYFLLG
jgi:hypothetical protein